MGWVPPPPEPSIPKTVQTWLVRELQGRVLLRLPLEQVPPFWDV
jgi:hypothetical protein